MKRPSTCNSARGSYITPLLTIELGKCDRRRLKFRSIGLLAAYLAPRLCVHRTTLIRNKSYRSVLLRYLIRVGGLENLGPLESDPVTMKTKLAISDLEISSLKQEVVGLRAQLAMRQKEFSPNDGARDYAETAMVLVEVLRRSQMSFQIDHANRTIIDLAAKPSERLVAGPRRAGKFIEWLEQNQTIPAIAKLR